MHNFINRFKPSGTGEYQRLPASSREEKAAVRPTPPQEKQAGDVIERTAAGSSSNVIAKSEATLKLVHNSDTYHSVLGNIQNALRNEPFGSLQQARLAVVSAERADVGNQTSRIEGSELEVKKSSFMQRLRDAQ